MGRIVVGYDGSDHARAALSWAGAVAGRRRSEVFVCESWHEPAFCASLAEVVLDFDQAEQAERAELTDVLAELGREHPDVVWSADLVPSAPADALIDASRDAELLVVGARGRGGFTSLLLGSVSQRVAWDAACSVAVVRSEVDPSGPVVVGVDGSAASRAALAWAAVEAAQRGVGLRAVLVWHPLAPVGAGRTALPGPGDDVDADGLLARIAREVLGDDVGLDLELDAVRDTPAKALLERASGASLLVVGPGATASGSGRFGGSVCSQLLHHAPCPLVIVRG